MLLIKHAELAVVATTSPYDDGFRLKQLFIKYTQLYKLFQSYSRKQLQRPILLAYHVVESQHSLNAILSQTH